MDAHVESSSFGTTSILFRTTPRLPARLALSWRYAKTNESTHPRADSHVTISDPSAINLFACASTIKTVWQPWTVRHPSQTHPLDIRAERCSSPT